MITEFCVICGATSNLHVHHIIPKGSVLKPKADYDDPTNLLTLCATHHAWIHGCKPNKFNSMRALQAEGIRKAKAKGKFKGRPPKIDKDKIREVLSQGYSISKTAKICGVSMSSVQRAKREAI